MMTTTIDDSGEEWEFIFSAAMFFFTLSDDFISVDGRLTRLYCRLMECSLTRRVGGGFCILKLYFLFRLNDFSRSPSDHCCCSTLSSPAVRISISIACSTLSATPSALNERITQHEYFLTVERMKKCYIPLRYEEEKFQLSRQQAEQ